VLGEARGVQETDVAAVLRRRYQLLAHLLQEVPVRVLVSVAVRGNGDGDGDDDQHHDDDDDDDDDDDNDDDDDERCGRRGDRAG
jgi:hypothetical protein